MDLIIGNCKSWSTATKGPLLWCTAEAPVQTARGPVCAPVAHPGCSGAGKEAVEEVREGSDSSGIGSGPGHGVRLGWGGSQQQTCTQSPFSWPDMPPYS